MGNGKEVPKTDNVIMKDETDEPKPGTSEVSASASNIRLPIFWANNPKLWFLTAEVQFSVQKIKNDETKYMHTLASLSTEACGSIQDLLEQPPDENKYESLKLALIERNSMSAERKLEALLDKSEMGDMKPSEVLRQIKLMAGSSYSQELIKSLWMRKLTEFIRIALLSQPEDKTSDELARTADKLYDVQNQPVVGAVTRSSRPNQRNQYHRSHPTPESKRPSSTNSSSLDERMERMERMLERLTNRSRSRSQSRHNSSRPNFRSNSRNRQSRNSGTCWYHNKFGNQAQKCTKPCHFNKTNTDIMAVDQSTPNQ